MLDGGWAVNDTNGIYLALVVCWGRHYGAL